MYKDKWAHTQPMGPKSTLRLMRTLGPSSVALAQSSWSLLVMALVTGPFLGRIASICPRPSGHFIQFIQWNVVFILHHILELNMNRLKMSYNMFLEIFSQWKSFYNQNVFSENCHPMTKLRFSQTSYELSSSD